MDDHGRSSTVPTVKLDKVYQLTTHKQKHLKTPKHSSTSRISTYINLRSLPPSLLRRFLHWRSSFLVLTHQSAAGVANSSSEILVLSRMPNVSGSTT
eukprot:TRINITY_DN67294_c0_g1_i1.p1 TRINITY_DN67294_c0_g1~~TRINITY_DN67294_c0_g1_i1.p1  ORF type:complete len:112 (-),score=19.16 TRINITY_DN67294_c0_g1_i1:327-617(-)